MVGAQTVSNSALLSTFNGIEYRFLELHTGSQTAKTLSRSHGDSNSKPKQQHVICLNAEPALVYRGNEWLEARGSAHLPVPRRMLFCLLARWTSAR
jgi:hypothetical protein